MTARESESAGALRCTGPFPSVDVPVLDVGPSPGTPVLVGGVNVPVGVPVVDDPGEEAAGVVPVPAALPRKQWEILEKKK